MDVQRNAKLFDDYNSAYSYMRTTIKKLVLQSNEFGLKESEHFEAFRFCLEDEYLKDSFACLDGLINRLVFDENYIPSESDIVSFRYTDIGDHYFCYVSDSEKVIANYYELNLSFNIHLPDDGRDLFFSLFRCDKYGNVVSEIELELLCIDE